MQENNLPRWSARLDAFRPLKNSGFADLNAIVTAHFYAHESATDFLGPYNARQRSSTLPYTPPDKELLSQNVKQGKMNDISYNALLNSIIKFCQQHKGLRALPTPHPSVIHSIQLPFPAFELKQNNLDTEVYIMGADHPLVVKGLRDANQIKFIIVRPKLSSLGTASALKWEVLFFKHALGYIPDWVDSNINPRWSGIYS
jgi:hypothetical protein